MHEQRPGRDFEAIFPIGEPVDPIVMLPERAKNLAALHEHPHGSRKPLPQRVVDAPSLIHRAAPPRANLPYEPDDQAAFALKRRLLCSPYPGQVNLCAALTIAAVAGL